MEHTTALTMDSAFFSGKLTDGVLIIQFREFLIRSLDIQTKESLFSYLRLAEQSEHVKIIMLFTSENKMGRNEYLDFYQDLLADRTGLYKLERFYNALNQLIIRLCGIKKIILHVDRGMIVPPFLNISLACDYRIVSDTAVFQNISLTLGLPPKGGGVFFLSRIIGAAKTLELLISGRNFDASEALTLGLVDKIIPLLELESGACAVARDFAQKPQPFLTGLKGLLNYGKTTITDFLEYESDVLHETIRAVCKNGHIPIK